MSKEEHSRRIKEEVDKTLEMMDRMENLKAGPHFYSQIRAKIYKQEKEEKRQWFPNSLLGLSLKHALLVLLMVVNVVSAVFFLLQPRQETAAPKDYSVYVSDFVEDYSLNRNTYASDITKKMMESSQ